jgi:pyruvate dehydrogenase E2 component (dihydrolipoamide acetyltransferase)
MAKVEVPMPQMGESIAEGTVSTWLKKVGDTVERDEPIMEISTDKVDAEIPAPAAGTIVEVVVKEGETVEVGTIVAYIETEAGAAAAASPSESPAPEPEAGTPEEEPATPVSGEAQDKAQRDAGTSTATAPAGVNGGGPATLEERLRQRSSPLVRRIAAEHGVNIASVEGSGRHGRVTKDDILSFIESGGAEPAAARDAPAPRKQRERAAGEFSWDEFYAHVEHPETAVGARDRVEPMSRMTSLIAEHMVLSKRISAHVHSYFEIDYSRIDQVRASSRKVMGGTGRDASPTLPLSRTPSRRHFASTPVINASVSGENGSSIGGRSTWASQSRWTGG